MAYRFTPADRGVFKRCRRQCDFGARERQNHEPAGPAGVPDLDRAVRVDRFGPADELLLDEELVAACWAMERLYPGMRVAGTVHNELRRPRPANLPVGVSWPSAGGRLQAVGGGAATSGAFPSTRPAGAAGRSPTPAAASPGPARPTPRPWPARATGSSGGPGALRDLPVRGPVPGHGARRRRPGRARGRLRDRGPEQVEPGRLGAVTWGMGRGAAPPRFDSR